MIKKLSWYLIKLVLHFCAVDPVTFPHFAVVKHNATGNPVLCKYGQDILCILPTIFQKNLSQYK